MLLSHAKLLYKARLVELFFLFLCVSYSLDVYVIELHVFERRIKALTYIRSSMIAVIHRPTEIIFGDIADPIANEILSFCRFCCAKTLIYFDQKNAVSYVILHFISAVRGN